MAPGFTAQQQERGNKNYGFWCHYTTLVTLHNTGVTTQHGCHYTTLVSLHNTGVTPQHWCHYTTLVSLHNTGVTAQHCGKFCRKYPRLQNSVTIYWYYLLILTLFYPCTLYLNNSITFWVLLFRKLSTFVREAFNVFGLQTYHSG